MSNNTKIDKSTLEFGTKLFHTIFNTVEICYVSSLEDFNTDPDTICVMFNKKDDSTIKLVSLDSVGFSSLQNKGDTSEDIINVLSSYLLKAIKDDSLVKEVKYNGNIVHSFEEQDKNTVNSLIKIHEFLWSHILRSHKQETPTNYLKIMHAKLWHEVFEKSNIYILHNSIKHILVQKGVKSLVSLLSFFEVIE